MQATKVAFHNVSVTITPTPDGSGNTLGRLFKVNCQPENFVVNTSYAVINYQLVGDTPEGIVFDGFDRARPKSRRQLSEPTISTDGKMMTLNDYNTDHEPLLIVLRFRDSTVTLYDPEVTNVPQPSLED